MVIGGGGFFVHYAKEWIEKWNMDTWVTDVVVLGCAANVFFMGFILAYSICY
jgi:hypothetical protein